MLQAHINCTLDILRKAPWFAVPWPNSVLLWCMHCRSVLEAAAVSGYPKLRELVVDGCNSLGQKVVSAPDHALPHA